MRPAVGRHQEAVVPKPSVFVTRALPGDPLPPLRQLADVDVWPDEAPPPHDELVRRAASAGHRVRTAMIAKPICAMNLSTTYLGLKLRTPLVPAASPLSENIDDIKKMEDAGASAVVLYSLFEEQLRQDRAELHQSMEQGTESFAEALTYFPEP